MKKLITICLAYVLFATLVITACVTPASATMRPGSSFDLGLPDPFQIDLYEPEPDPNPEFSTWLLPELVVSGFVVLQEPEDLAIWSDIVEFYDVIGPGGAKQSYADFWSDIDIAGWEFDLNLVDRVVHGNTVYLVEDHYPTVYDLGYPNDNLYRIWSIPEPATVALLGLGALSLLRRKK
jgi:hypothetical protein